MLPRLAGKTAAVRAGRLLLDILLPRTCLHCKRDLSFSTGLPLCPDCLAQLKEVPKLFCQRCGVPLPDGGAHCFHCRGSKAAQYKCSLIRSAQLFNPEARSLAHHFKYRGKTALAPFMAGRLVIALERYGELAPFSVIVPVPVSPDRFKERGYNQSLLLARELGKLSGLEVWEDVLVKVRETRQQALLGRDERAANLLDAFAVAKPAAVRRRHILLVDDVATTGATLEACAMALKKAGALRVAALTFARE